jgi:hypothetical protein
VGGGEQMDGGVGWVEERRMGRSHRQAGDHVVWTDQHREGWPRVMATERLVQLCRDKLVAFNGGCVACNIAVAQHHAVMEHKSLLSSSPCHNGLASNTACCRLCSTSMPNACVCSFRALVQCSTGKSAQHQLTQPSSITNS